MYSHNTLEDPYMYNTSLRAQFLVAPNSHMQPTPTLPLTFAISLDSSIMLDWISGIFIKFCIAFITSVLFEMEPAILIIAERKTQYNT